MNRTTVNFSTGPVNISKEVQAAFLSPPITHRSPAFCDLFFNTVAFLCQQFKVKYAFLLTGSGTTANEAMMAQIKMLPGKGLILSNGEFGSRLISQANRASLSFQPYDLGMEGLFDLQEIEKMIHQLNNTWVLCCHCETSTGVVNNLQAISNICRENNCLCFVDCMSTVGTQPLDLSTISMATASSGKGLGSLPGIGIILSNIHPASDSALPVHLDLAYYLSKNGIPFTISSNQVHALHISIKQKLQSQHFALVESFATACYQLLSNHDMLPFQNKDSRVFTISPLSEASDFTDKLRSADILLSYESAYLKSANLCQLAFFGYYNESALRHLMAALHKFIPDTRGPALRAFK